MESQAAKNLWEIATAVRRIALSWLAVALLFGVSPVSAEAGAAMAARSGWVRSRVGAASSEATALHDAVARAAAASGGDVALPANASTTGLTVALDAGAGHQYLFWRGSDGRIYEATYRRRWRGPSKTPWFSSSTPSAAVGLHGVLYLAWQGAGKHIFEATFDGKWQSPTDLTRANRWGTNGQATSAVSLAVNPRNGTQFLMWRGTDGRIHEASRGAGWHRPLVMPWTVVSGAPSLAVTRAGHLYAVWAGPGGDIEEAWYRSGWQGPLDLTSTYGWGEFGQAATRPTIAVNPVDESQYLYWTAADGHVYEAWYSRGWHGPLNTGWSGGSAPAVGVTPTSRQYVFWQGPDGETWESWFVHTWTGPIAPLQTDPAGPEVEVTQTTANLSERLARLRSTSFAAPPPTGLPLITVDESQRYQSFTGVGGAMTDSSAWLIYDELDAATRTALMNDLFGSAGVHFGFTIVPMGGSDFTATGQPYTYDDLPAGETDPQLTQFSIAHDEAYILPTLREMLAVNPQTTVMATPWTAPPWMKANDSYNDQYGLGTLNPSAFQPFADYFVKFLQAYAAQGVPVTAIAPENEPNSSAQFPAMNFPTSSEAQWITQNLEPSLQAANLDPRLYGGDVVWANSSDSSAILSSQAGGALAGVAWHCYGGLPDVMSDSHTESPDADQIVTECSQGLSHYPVPEVLIGSLRNWASVVALWNLALDPAGGPVQPPNYGCPRCTGDVTINENTHTVKFRLAYFQLGQVSEFVEPGAIRIGSNSFVSYSPTSSNKWSSSAGLDDVAFVNPDGTRVLVVYNNSTSPTRFGVAWNGQGFKYSLPANATVTFSWKP